LVTCCPPLEDIILPLSGLTTTVGDNERWVQKGGEHRVKERRVGTVGEAGMKGVGRVDGGCSSRREWGRVWGEGGGM